jgi:hypothetical protein
MSLKDKRNLEHIPGRGSGRHGYSKSEHLHWSRRDILIAASTWAGAQALSVQAEGRSNIVSQTGDVLVNDKMLAPHQSIRAGDRISTGPGSALIVVMGKDAFQLRANTQVTFEGHADGVIVQTLRIIQGGVVSIWSKGDEPKRITTPTMVAGIRGTGVYTEVFEKQDNRSYFCTCYGSVELTAGTDKKLSSTSYHEAFWAEPQPKKGKYLTPAKMLNHTDSELENLAQWVQQQTAWQITGFKSGGHEGY